jgi:hypothetical protein
MRIARAAIAILCLALPAAAQWSLGGKSLPDTRWRKSAGDLGVWLLLVQDPNGLMQAWSGSVDITKFEKNRIARGTKFGIGVIFANCAPNAAGRCDLFADYSIHSADGTELIKMPNVDIWTHRPRDKWVLELSDGVWRPQSGPKQTLGKYLVRAVVTDRVAGKTVKLEKPFTFVEKK